MYVSNEVVIIPIQIMYYDKQRSHVVLDPKHSVCSIISVELNVILCFTVFGQFKWRVDLYGQGSFWSHCTICFSNSNEGLKYVLTFQNITSLIP